LKFEFVWFPPVSDRTGPVNWYRTPSVQSGRSGLKTLGPGPYPADQDVGTSTAPQRAPVTARRGGVRELEPGSRDGEAARHRACPQRPGVPLPPAHITGIHHHHARRVGRGRGAATRIAQARHADKLRPVESSRPDDEQGN
jgi:hypothetical protein